MALIICPDCGKEVSDKANACPNCGYPISEMEMRKEVLGQEVAKILAETVIQPKTQAPMYLFSTNDTHINIECGKCGKVYSFSKKCFSHVSSAKCVPNTIVKCPNCGNAQEANNPIVNKPKLDVKKISENTSDVRRRNCAATSSYKTAIIFGHKKGQVLNRPTCDLYISADVDVNFIKGEEIVLLDCDGNSVTRRYINEISNNGQYVVLQIWDDGTEYGNVKSITTDVDAKNVDRECAPQANAETIKKKGIWPWILAACAVAVLLIVVFLGNEKRIEKNALSICKNYNLEKITVTNITPKEMMKTGIESVDRIKFYDVTIKCDGISKMTREQVLDLFDDIDYSAIKDYSDISPYGIFEIVIISDGAEYTYDGGFQGEPDIVYKDGNEYARGAVSAYSSSGSETTFYLQVSASDDKFWYAVSAAQNLVEEELKVPSVNIGRSEPPAR